MEYRIVKSTVLNIASCASSGSYLLCSKNPDTGGWEIEDVSPASFRIDPDIVKRLLAALNNSTGADIRIDSDIIDRVFVTANNSSGKPQEKGDGDGDLTNFSDDEDEGDGEIGDEEIDLMIEQELHADEDQLLAIRGMAELISQGGLQRPVEDECALGDRDETHTNPSGVVVSPVPESTYIRALEGIVSEAPGDTNELDFCDRLMWGLDPDVNEADSEEGSMDQPNLCDDITSLFGSTKSHIHSQISPSPDAVITTPRSPTFEAPGSLPQTAEEDFSSPQFTVENEQAPSMPPRHRSSRLASQFVTRLDESEDDEDEELPSMPQRRRSLLHQRSRTAMRIDSEEETDDVDDSYEPVDDEDEGANMLSPRGRVLPSESPKKKKFRNTLTSNPSSLITTPFLKSCKLAYHFQYQFIVCIPCQMQWDPNASKYVTDSGERHSSPLPPKMSRVGFKKRITDELTQELRERNLLESGEALDILTSYSTSHSNVREGKWLESVKPDLDQEGPVEGLKVYEHAEESIRHHYTPINPEGPKRKKSTSGKPKTKERKYCIDHDVGRQRGDKLYTIAPVQSFFMANAVRALFPVIYPSQTNRLRSMPVPPTLPSSSSSIDFSFEALADLIDQEESRYESTMCTKARCASELVEPVFVKMNMVDLWEQIPMPAVRKVLSIRPVRWDTATEPTRRLFAAISVTFMSICSKVKRADPGLLALIGKGAALYESPKGRPFSIPQKESTLHAYLLFEVQLLRRMLYVLRRPIERTDQTRVFRFNDTQEEALRRLEKALCTKALSLVEVGDCVQAALETLYFPQCPEKAVFDVFDAPLSTYLALAQFSVRLRAYHHIYQDFQQWSAPVTKPTPTKASSPPATSTVLHYESTSTPPVVEQHHTPPSPSNPPHHESLFTPPTTPHHKYLFTPQSEQHHSPAGSLPSPSPVLQRTLRPRNPRIAGSNAGSNAGSESDVEMNNLSSDYHESESESGGANWDFTGPRSNVVKEQDEDDRMEVDERAGTQPTAKVVPRAGDATVDGWFSHVKSWSRKYLTPGNISPYSMLRHFMHLTSVHQFRAHKHPNMQWVNDDLLVVDQKHQFVPSKFFNFVDYQLEQLEVFFKDRVLRGFSLGDLDVVCDFTKLKDSGDVKTEWYSCLLPLKDMQNEDSKKFLVNLLQRGDLVSPLPGAEMDWKCEGSPGRTTEENLMQIANTVSRRHLFVESILGTLAIFSNYWKGAKAQGRFKEILRVLPYRISRLLFILIRVVRPVEHLFIMRFESLKNQESFTTNYRTKLWASGGHQLGNRVLMDSVALFFKHPDRYGNLTFEWISGVRPYHHLTVAIQRRLLPGPSRYSPEVAKAGVDIGDLQAGRSDGVSAQNYAVLSSFIPAESGLISHYQALSMRWHGLFGQSTGFESDRVYIV
ncbi:hypothetical protein H1R20_g3097, partial [Candolleomyces eurysporus]